MSANAIAAGGLIVGAAGVIAAVAGVIVAARAARKSDEIACQANDTSARLAALEEARRQDERRPVLSARLVSRLHYPDRMQLEVWLESGEALASLTVTFREAHNYGCPVGFAQGQDGVNQADPGDDAPGIMPGWKGDPFRPSASWEKRLGPGTAAGWDIGVRPSADRSDGTAGIRLTAWCRAEDGTVWALTVPLVIGGPAAEFIGSGIRG